MRPIVLRSVIAVLTVCGAACSGEALRSPASPTGVPAGAGRQAAQSGSQLPLHGAFRFDATGVSIPPTRVSTATATGTSTELGRFTATIVDNVNLPTATATGTFTLTAANGDQLFATTSGGEDAFVPPNVSHTTSTATIVGGTGRFAAATGVFTVHAITTIDFIAATSTGTGTFDGVNDLNR